MKSPSRIAPPVVTPVPHTDEATRVHLLAHGIVVAEGGRCVECGICCFSCPSGIDVRAVARAGGAVTDRRCILCGSCIERCPRGTLGFLLLPEAP